MAASTNPMRLLALGLLLALAACRLSQQLAISSEHHYKQPETAARAPNDDLHLSADHSSYTNYKHQYKQQLKQQQWQRERAPDSGRAVINGNQATYVEPPADFKPIIYEPAASSLSDAAAPAAELFESGNQLASVRPQQHLRFPMEANQRTGPASTNEEPQGFKLVPSAPVPAPPTNNQDEKRPMEELTSGPALENDERPLEANELPLKPSIGRWSDWHDMSIEPDLAASDSQAEPLSASKLSPPRKAQSALKTRYGSAMDTSAIKLPARLNANARNRQQQSVAGESRRVQRRPAWPEQSPGPLRVMTLNLEEARNEQFYAANLNSLQQAAAGERTSAAHSPLYQLAAGHHYRRPSPLMSSAAAAQLERHQPRPEPEPEPEPQTRQKPLYLVSPAFAQAPPSPMHFLMAHNHPSRPMPRSHFGEQQRDISPAERRAERRPSRTPARKPLEPAARENAEVRLIQSAAGRLLDADSQVSAALTSAKEAPRVFSLPDAGRTATKSPASVQVSGSAGLANKLAGNSSRSAASSAAPPAKPRVLKRRRIRTQLPVGLSSWMLGGIRDLDARHWKLPADVLSKLAVNDVDLFHPEQPAAAATAAGSSAFAGFEDSTTTDIQAPAASALERAGPAVASSSAQRVPAGSQHIPR